jgi:hypothetical protein
VGRTEVPGTLADVVNCTHWTDYSETDNFPGQTSLWNKSAISPSHILAARTLCDGGGRCIGRNAKSAEQVVGKGQEAVASSAAAGTGSMHCNNQQVSGHGSFWINCIFSA